MEKEVFREIMKNLEGLNYCFIGGFAVKVYSGGKRKSNDLDIVMSFEELNEFAKRIGTKAEHRVVEKNGMKMKDYGFVKDFRGQEIEGLTAPPGDKTQEDHIEFTLKHKTRRDFLGEEIFLAPIEELVVHKFLLGREKDKRDLELLKENPLKNELVKVISSQWEPKSEKRVLESLNEMGFRII